jgi:hypothetical protein
MEKQLPLAPGGAFTLETEVGAVTVVGDSAADVFVVVTSPRDDLARRMDFKFDAQTGAVRVRATRRSHLIADWLRNWGWNDRLRFEVHVPRRTGVAVQTAGGFVKVTDLDGGYGYAVRDQGHRVKGWLLWTARMGFDPTMRYPYRCG